MGGFEHQLHPLKMAAVHLHSTADAAQNRVPFSVATHLDDYYTRQNFLMYSVLHVVYVHYFLHW
jgi:hypothetical protein